MVERKIGILLNYTSLVLSAVTGLLYVPILLHYIGKNEYGVYQLIGSLIAYFSIIDFSGAIVRFYSKAKALADVVMMENILGTALRGYFFLAILIVFVGIGIYYHLDKAFSNSFSLEELNIAKEIFALLIFNISLTMISTPFRAVMTSYEKFLVLKSIDIIQFVLQPILVIFFLHDFPTAVTVVVIQTLLNIIGIIFRVYYVTKVLKVHFRFHYYDKLLVNNFSKLAMSFFFVGIIDQIFFKTNQVVLGIVSGAEDVVVYAIAATIYASYMSLSTAISSVYLPYVTELIAKKRPVAEISNLFITVGRWQSFLLGFVLSAFFLFGKVFIDKWAGEGFVESYYIALIIMIPFTIDLIQNLGLSILQGYNKYDVRAKVYWLVGIFNIIAVVPLAIKWGAIGCAWGTGISMFLSNGLIMNWYYYKKIKLDIPGFWRSIGKIIFSVFIAGALGWLILQFLTIDSIVELILGIIVYLAVYGFFIWYISMKKNEKDILKKGISGLTRFI